jgi:hypothetical protein
MLGIAAEANRRYVVALSVQQDQREWERLQEERERERGEYDPETGAPEGGP